MKLHTIIYTMEGCPFCEEIKQKLTENNIEFIDRDINKFEGEYDDFVKITESDFVPALLIIEESIDKVEPFFYVPEKDFDLIDDAVKIIKEHNERTII